MTDIKTKPLKFNLPVIKSLTTALTSTSVTLTNKKVTGYLLVINYDEEVRLPHQKESEIVKSFDLHALGSIEELLNNAEIGIVRTGLKLRQEKLNTDPRYH